MLKSDRKKLAKAARELAETATREQFGKYRVFEDDKPCCVFGHLLARIGYDGPKSDPCAYAFLGVPGSDAIPDPVWQANDGGTDDELRAALRAYADDLESAP